MFSCFDSVSQAERKVSTMLRESQPHSCVPHLAQLFLWFRCQCQQCHDARCTRLCLELLKEKMPFLGKAMFPTKALRPLDNTFRNAEIGQTVLLLSKTSVPFRTRRHHFWFPGCLVFPSFVWNLLWLRGQEQEQCVDTILVKNPTTNAKLFIDVAEPVSFEVWCFS